MLGGIQYNLLKRYRVISFYVLREYDRMRTCCHAMHTRTVHGDPDRIKELSHMKLPRYR